MKLDLFFGERKFSLFIRFIILFLFETGFCHCKKSIEVDPPLTALSSSNVYDNNLTAASVLTGLYQNIVGSGSNFLSGPNSITLRTGLSSDELTEIFPDPSLSAFYSNSLTSNDPQITDIWQNLYQFIYVTNAAINGLTNSKSLSDATKKQLLGESRFMRAFLYFYAYNLYGDVPLIITTDYKSSSIASRTHAGVVLNQIIADLTEAQNLLSSDYVASDGVTATTERVRPTKWAATAMLARAYLFSGNNDSASAEATAIINNSALYHLENDLNNAFLANSSEAIWQLQPVSFGYDTYDGYTFILIDDPSQDPNTPAVMSPFLLSAFESGDLRRLDWVKDTTINSLSYSYPFKYKVKGGSDNAIPLSEYLMVLRLSEQYLIRAEAETTSSPMAAIADLNIIRRRAGLNDYSGPGDQKSVLAAIMHERQVELFAEWGFRWLDLKRTNSVDLVMNIVTPQKGGIWNSNWSLYPIPISEILSDPNLKQNNGY